MYMAVVPPGTIRRKPARPAGAAPAARKLQRRRRPLPRLPAAGPAGTASTAVTSVKPAAAPAKDESIRIDAVKLDALLEVAGESVQAANQAAVLLERLRSSSSKARPPP
jgi:two-component system chemotaxis sensor kinase CheA